MRAFVVGLALLTACGTAHPQSPEPPPADPDSSLAPPPTTTQTSPTPPVPKGPPAPTPGVRPPHFTLYEPIPGGSEPKVGTPPTPSVTPPAPAPESPSPTSPTAPEPIAPPPTAPAALAPTDALVEACTVGPLPRCADAVAHGDPLDPRVILQQARLAAWNAVDTTSIGLLLPLSGPYAKLGEAAKEAIDLALADPSAAAIHLVVRDTEGDADKAAALATELILHERVAALLGPIGRKESAAVANVARFFAVPAVPFTSEVPPADAAPDPVLRLRTSASELIAALARHARVELRVERVAMLVPDNDAARAAAAAFKAELERLGGTVVREVPFDANAKDFAEPLKALVPDAPLTRAAPTKPSKPHKKPPKPALDFDALFLPADAVVVRRVVPFLAYWGIEPRTAPGDKGRVQLLGAAGWDHPAVVDKGEHLTNNAVFVDVFAPDDPDAGDFGSAFYLRLQRRPTAFHAEVWDATRFVAAAVGALGHDLGRLAVRDALLAPRVLVGATGTLALGPGGRFEPRAHLMTIDGDDVRRRYSEDEERARRAAPPTDPADPPDPIIPPDAPAPAKKAR